MKLTDVFTGQLKNTNTQNTSSSQVQSTQNASVGRQIQALAPGQTLQGEVVSREGNQVQIKVADDFILEAKVDAQINLEVGKMMTFEVRNNGQTLQLSPLFANTATQANALKALEMASLPVTQDTIAMTGLMMEAGLPIDKNSLQQMFREINTFPNANISDVVDLHRLGLDVDEENLTQLSSYKNQTHQLVEGMHVIQGNLSETIGSMVSEGNVEGAAKMFQELLQLVQGIAQNAGEYAAQEETGLAAGAEQGAQGAVKTGTTQIITDGTVDANIIKTPAEQLQEVLTNAVKEMSAGKDETVLNLVSGMDAGHVGATDDSGKQVLSLQESLAAVVRSMGQSGTYDDLLQQLNQALRTGDVAAQAKAMQELLAQGLKDGNTRLLETLVGHKGATKLLNEGLSKLWTITPEEVADSGKVEELYTRLNRQLKDMGQILEQNGQNQSAAFKAVSNMSQNIDFLQQLNQTFTYVQLPLRLQNGEQHGELYVYTNKRNLSAKEGKISALLHLDMEYLGPVDVYVAMQAEHVNTRFYVQDDEMLDFLEQHMDILTQRLQKRGYQCDLAMQVRGEDTKDSGIKEMLAKEQAQPIAQYAFDVRA